ncbi:hypothetical protein Pcinc_025183 [Petrolisthes cinctipes]|uniref:Uncharacterized protein n=1 Tax=Petrolisthes cinctipes TaxID=88211 RepID=A0AAE1FAH7_PETCI|nr:hypothetical protein Pcinc_025183 [Petrolisthes cinctipes]
MNDSHSSQSASLSRRDHGYFLFTNSPHPALTPPSHHTLPLPCLLPCLTPHQPYLLSNLLSPYLPAPASLLPNQPSQSLPPCPCLTPPPTIPSLQPSQSLPPCPCLTTPQPYLLSNLLSPYLPVPSLTAAPPYSIPSISSLQFNPSLFLCPFLICPTLLYLKHTFSPFQLLASLPLPYLSCLTPTNTFSPTH